MLQNTIAALLHNFIKDYKKEGTVFASAARTATVTSADITATAGQGVVVVLDVTAGSTLSLTVAIQRKDVASGKYVTVLTGAAVTGVSTNTYKVYPGLTAAANLTVNDVITGTFRVVVTHGNATSATYSVGYALV
jgi:hypothetical protein